MSRKISVKKKKKQPRKCTHARTHTHTHTHTHTPPRERERVTELNLKVFRSNRIAFCSNIHLNLKITIKCAKSKE